MSSSLETFYCIPHTHWEGAVFKTREEYLKIGLPHILQALRLLKMHPEYRFTLDQSCYVQPFLERYPEEADAFRAFVAQGRLALVGGTLVMADVNMPGGESFVRQILLGKGFFRRELGTDITTSWQLDTFGHHAQMPQILKLAGYESFWFMRGVESFDSPAEFFWEGIDGTQIAAYWDIDTYGNLCISPTTFPEFTDFVNQRFDSAMRAATGAGCVGFAGADVHPPEEHFPDALERFGRDPERKCELRFSVPADFEAAVSKMSSRKAIAREMNPIFQGIYSSRIEIKQATRELETLLTTSEKFGAMLLAQGIATDAAELWRGWDPMLFNQAHDIMSGVMVDHVYEDTMAGFAQSRHIAVVELESRLAELNTRVDTRGVGIPVVVTNTLGSPRTDLATVKVGLSEPSAKSVRVVDSRGAVIPSQIVAAERLSGGELVTATVAFVAREIPALGHAVFHVQPVDGEAANAPVETAEIAALENEYYRVQIDSASGAITQITVKDGGWDALSAPGNVVAMQEDKGDFWEPFKPLDPGSRTTMTDRHEPPMPGEAVFSTGQTGELGTVTRGPVFSEFTVTHPFSEKGAFATTVRLIAGLRRIEVRTRILNNDSAVRYRVLFPTSITSGHNVHEIPFGAIERPDSIEYPAQNWTDWGDGARGVTLLNRGLPGSNVSGGVIMLSLMRCSSIVAYAYMGGYEPGAGSDTGQELGRELTFDYALSPYAGDWRAGSPWQQGQAFNQPLIARTSGSHDGALAPRWGFLSSPAPNVVVSALKPGENGDIVLRVYDAAGTGADAVAIALPDGVSGVDEVDLMEDLVRSLTVSGGKFTFDLHPFEIKSFALRVPRKVTPQPQGGTR